MTVATPKLALRGDLLAFTRSVTQLRSEDPVFRRRRFFAGRGQGDGLGGNASFTPAATLMTH